jgi:crotonobetainyl-CoA:carnitine CoA-transferase CaiB-like acyl-CoA transferase
VIELTKVWAGPYVGKLLAFLGAEVIRIESESSLDVTRTYGVKDINNAPGFQAVNPQKLSVQIDVKTPEGVRLILELQPPAGMNVRYADSTFGTAAAYAALVALIHRRRSGVGQFIDVSAVESMSSMIGDVIMDFTLNGVAQTCDGNRHADMAPHGAYPCLDSEWISIAINSDAAWRALTEQMERPDLAGYSLAERKAKESELDALIAQWTQRQSAAQLTIDLQARGVAAAKSATSVDLVSDPHLWDQGFFLDVAVPGGGTRTIVGPSWRMARSATVMTAAPRLGEHNDYVLGELLGLSTAERNRLNSAGITR